MRGERSGVVTPDTCLLTEFSVTELMGDNSSLWLEEVERRIFKSWR